MQLNQENVQAAFKNCAPFASCISDIRNTECMRLKTEGKCKAVVFKFQMFNLGLR